MIQFDQETDMMIRKYGLGLRDFAAVHVKMADFGKKVQRRRKVNNIENKVESKNR